MLVFRRLLFAFYTFTFNIGKSKCPTGAEPLAVMADKMAAFQHLNLTWYNQAVQVLAQQNWTSTKP